MPIPYSVIEAKEKYIKSQCNKEMGMYIINIEVYLLMFSKHIIIQLFFHNDL